MQNQKVTIKIGSITVIIEEEKHTSNVFFDKGIHVKDCNDTINQTTYDGKTGVHYE